jgi:hypothetical protein
MRNCFRLCLTICCFTLVVSNRLCAQTGADSVDLRPDAINKVKAVFNKAIGQQSALYNGPQYLFYNRQQFSGSAYFQENTTSLGNVNYDGVEFKNVQLVYDLYKDELITLLYDNNSNFCLLKEDVKNFDLLGHHFVNINADTLTSNTSIKSGYYDELYHGRAQVLARVSKQVQVATSSVGTPEAYSFFTQAAQAFFIRKDNIYYPVDGEGALLKVLKDQKAQLLKYIKTNKIKFNKDRGQAMSSLAAYYDSLSN